MTRLATATCLAALAALLLASCKSDEIPVSTNYDPLYRFPASASYVWDDAASSLPDVESVDRAATDKLLKDVANEAFAARGWHLASGGQADYRLSYQYLLRTFTGVDDSHATGSVSLMLVESASGRRVWLGFGQAQVYVGLTPEERKARLKDVLTRMLQNFPPSQRPAS